MIALRPLVTRSGIGPFSFVKVGQMIFGKGVLRADGAAFLLTAMIEAALILQSVFNGWYGYCGVAFVFRDWLRSQQDLQINPNFMRTTALREQIPPEGLV